MKNRRELLKLLPFLAAAPFVRIPKEAANALTGWKSYPHHETVDLPKPIDIHPYDLASLLGAMLLIPGNVRVGEKLGTIDINGQPFRYTSEVPVRTDGGKSAQNHCGDYRNIIFHSEGDGQVRNIVGGWVSGYKPGRNPDTWLTFTNIAPGTLSLFTMITDASGWKNQYKIISWSEEFWPSR